MAWVRVTLGCALGLLRLRVVVYGCAWHGAYGRPRHVCLSHWGMVWVSGAVAWARMEVLELQVDVTWGERIKGAYDVQSCRGCGMGESHN
eukprot:1159694-Pelagomonas_calceolata.AAC.1